MVGEPEIVAVQRMGNLLGEAPQWHPEEQALYWVDAFAQAIHRLDAQGQVATWRLPAIVASFAIRAGGGLIAALKTGFAAVDLLTGAVEPILDPEPDRLDNLLNDGKCDRSGRFWCGSRDAALAEPTGSLYRLDPDLTCRRMDQGFIVSNGIAWSPDDRTMYFADTRAETVWTYDFDLAEGRIGNRRPFISTLGIEGRVDGATVDAEGYYWTALVHGWSIARWDPKGRLDRVIRLPVKHPTMCTFGGPALDVLYVTTAASMVPEAERSAQPLAGALLAIHGLDVRGLPETKFAG